MPKLLVVIRCNLAVSISNISLHLIVLYNIHTHFSFLFISTNTSLVSDFYTCKCFVH